MSQFLPDFCFISSTIYHCCWIVLYETQWLFFMDMWPWPLRGLISYSVNWAVEPYPHSFLFLSQIDWVVSGLLVVKVFSLQIWTENAHWRIINVIFFKLLSCHYFYFFIDSSWCILTAWHKLSLLRFDWFVSARLVHWTILYSIKKQLVMKFLWLVLYGLIKS